MDNHQFDEIAKQVALAVTRRDAARAILVAALAAVMGHRALPDAARAASSCNDPLQPDGTPCDDGNLCTRTDVCIQGICVGRDPVVCPTATGQCKSKGTCDPATGLCIKGGNVPDGTPCNDGDPCTRQSTCQSGKCVGSDFVLTCDKGQVCIKDLNGQFICTRKNDVKAIDSHSD